MVHTGIVTTRRNKRKSRCFTPDILLQPASSAVVAAAIRCCDFGENIGTIAMFFDTYRYTGILIISPERCLMVMECKLLLAEPVFSRIDNELFVV